MQGERGIVGKVILEQVCYAVSLAVHTWLVRVGPTSLDQAAAHLDNYFLAEMSGSRKNWPPLDKGNPRVRPTGPGLAEPSPL